MSDTSPTPAPLVIPTTPDLLTNFPINWETEEVIALVEALLAARGLPGQFSPIEEEAYEYEELGPRDDGLEGHEVSIARMNYALEPHGWALVEVETGGDDHSVGAVPITAIDAFRSVQTGLGRNTMVIPPVQWGDGDTYK